MSSIKLSWAHQRMLAAALLAIDVLAGLNWLLDWRLVGPFAGQACATITIFIVIAFYTVLTGPDEDEREVRSD
jgi:hypothetical protein